MDGYGLVLVGDMRLILDLLNILLSVCKVQLIPTPHHHHPNVIKHSFNSSIKIQDPSIRLPLHS